MDLGQERIEFCSLAVIDWRPTESDREQLGLQERTFRRRLAAENASYGAIVDDVRRKLAIEYLQTTQMSVDDVAWKVGFSDSANLRRAIRRWTNKTVNEIRANK